MGPLLVCLLIGAAIYGYTKMPGSWQDNVANVFWWVIVLCIVFGVVMGGASFVEPHNYANPYS